MTTINTRLQNARKIDQEKLKLEASIIPKIKKTFSHLANDAAALYLTTGTVPAQELAENYYPEFLKEVRDALRSSVKYFGFNIRDTLQKDFGIFFDVEQKRFEFDVCCKKLVTISDPKLDDKLNGVNNNFMRAVTLFVANQSEEQTRYITDTNAKEIVDAIRQEEEKFRQQMQGIADNIADLQRQPITSEIADQIASARSQMTLQQAEGSRVIARNIQSNLLDKAVYRSELIAAQNVGLGESWAKQTEGELINSARLADAGGRTAEVKKIWTAILDSKTRPEHAAADYQKVGINDSFVVGGESLKYPRDPSGSAGNVINCRCLSQQVVEMN